MPSYANRASVAGDKALNAGVERFSADATARRDLSYDSGCFYDPSFNPAPYAAKIRPRDGNVHWPAMTAAQERVWSRIAGGGIAP